ncbi:MAG: hypothetical protein HUK26_03270 [Duodenibacillus sp.]|nr:hypothetical protein [Duodenibacillus sp.]
MKTSADKPQARAGLIALGCGQHRLADFATATALAAAAAGLPVIRSGAAAGSILPAFGLAGSPGPEVAARALQRSGIAFCEREDEAPAPAFAVIGAAREDELAVRAQALRERGVKRAFVVHSAGLAAAGVCAATRYAKLEQDVITFGEFVPKDFTDRALRAGDLARTGARRGAAEWLEVLVGRGKPALAAAVAANLALVLLAGELAGSLDQAMRLARFTLASGRALRTLSLARRPA